MFYLLRGHSRGVGFLFFFNLNQYEGLVEKNNIKKRIKEMAFMNKRAVSLKAV